MIRKRLIEGKFYDFLKTETIINSLFQNGIVINMKICFEEKADMINLNEGVGKALAMLI